MPTVWIELLEVDSNYLRKISSLGSFEYPGASSLENFHLSNAQCQFSSVTFFVQSFKQRVPQIFKTNVLQFLTSDLTAFLGLNNNSW